MVIMVEEEKAGEKAEDKPAEKAEAPKEGKAGEGAEKGAEQKSDEGKDGKSEAGIEVEGAPRRREEEGKKKAKEKKVEKKGKRVRTGRKHQKVDVYKLYRIEGGELIRSKKPCPRCGPGTWLAEHKGRLYCGRCSYTIFEKKVQ